MFLPFILYFILKFYYLCGKKEKEIEYTYAKRNMYVKYRLIVVVYVIFGYPDG